MRVFKIVTSFLLLFLLAGINRVVAQRQVLDNKMHHLRVGSRPEWLGFPGVAHSKLVLDFESPEGQGERTIAIRQEDVKRNWTVSLNGMSLGSLLKDENSMVVYLPVPAGLMKKGGNRLQIETRDTAADDISVGRIFLFDKPMHQLVTETRVNIEVAEDNTGALIPARLTIVNEDRSLQPVSATGQGLAIRTGCIYTGTGQARFSLPAGGYTVYANRGFEYGVDSFRFKVAAGESVNKKLVLSREVPLEGWVSSDTHIHTLTYSGHGDASDRERVLTLAGEGIELPIFTDHNRKLTLDSLASAMKMRRYFTPIAGFEYTTPVGHFNVFQEQAGGRVPGHRVGSWDAVVDSLEVKKDDKIVILNHGRDDHDRFRPFDPAHHISSAGWGLRNWLFPANAMEVFNSSAQQADFMCLFHDWFGMLNREYWLTPVGASDSHTVGQYLVGQGRTYIKANDDDPANIDVKAAIKNFRQGKVMVSFGLIAAITVNDQFGPGDIVPTSAAPLTVKVRVMGPAWARAERVSLYANGIKIGEEMIANGSSAGLKFKKDWVLPGSLQDRFLVAIAEGPGGTEPFWVVPKPYDPTSPVFNPRLVGASGAVWIDGDGDGERTTAYAYAQQLVQLNKDNLNQLVRELNAYDASVAIQVAAILQETGKPINGPVSQPALQTANAITRAAFDKFQKEYAATKRAGSNQSSP